MGRIITSDKDSIKQRFTVQEASRLLGISPEAVRTRLSRGKLKSAKEGRRVYVLLEPHITSSDTGRTDDQTRYVRSLEERVEHLRELLDGEREANRENRRIIAALTSRIPELEPGPSPEASESRETPPADAPSTSAPPDAEPRPWYRRIFGA
jgi:Helix-turn-helix domain